MIIYKTYSHTIKALEMIYEDIILAKNKIHHSFQVREKIELEYGYNDDDYYVYNQDDDDDYYYELTDKAQAWVDEEYQKYYIAYTNGELNCYSQ